MAPAGAAPLLIGARGGGSIAAPLPPSCHFEGKIEAPEIVGASCRSDRAKLVASWDFSIGAPGSKTLKP